jgi:hypothetical protein
MYNEYIVNIFKLSLHDSMCFIPAVYITALFFFWRIKMLISALPQSPHILMPYDSRG